MPGQYYKVTFANESGPISSYVSPLGPGACPASGPVITCSYRFFRRLTTMPPSSGTFRNGFKLAGENLFNGSEKDLLGWAPYSKLSDL